MTPDIDFEECLNDSPRFRASLEEAENGIDVLEVKLEKLVKLCNSMIDAGKSFNVANRSFINGVHDVAVYFRGDTMVTGALTKFTNVLNEINNYHSILMDQAQRSVCSSLHNFVKKEISKVKESRKHFEKISSDLDNALTKNAQAPKSRPQECEEANNVLTAMRSCFGHTSLDYVFQINVLHSRKRFDILDTLLAYMNAQNTFFHQGSDMFQDLEPFMKEVANQLSDLSVKAEKERKEMEERHVLVQKKKDMHVRNSGLPRRMSELHDVEVKMEGYLFKRTSNAFKSWVRNRDDGARFRRWFVIQKNQLVYRKRSKDSLTVMEEDLRICTAKPMNDSERRFCFELISPRGTHILQADSETSCHAWLSAIQESITKAYAHRQSTEERQLSKESPEPGGRPHSQVKDIHTSQSSPALTAGATAGAVVNSQPTAAKSSGPSDDNTKMQSTGHRLKQILDVPGNKACADCRSENPRWASINLGVTLCIACSGVHRSFGVQISKVRSLTLDDLPPEHVRLMCSLGNSVVNRLYEEILDESTAKRPSPESENPTREQFIRNKYIDKAFMNKLKPEDSGPSEKRWTVKRAKRKSDVKKAESQPVETSDLASTQTDGNGEGIIFGNASDIPVIPESEESGSETEADTESTTSWEDMSQLNPDMLLYKAAKAKNIAVMQQAVALGAQPNWHNTEQDGKTPLIMSIEAGSMTVLEYLLLNGAKVDIKDDRGQSPLHYAAIHGHTGQICQLLKRSANQNAYDEQHRTPLSIAVENANADIVTILRLSKLNEEMRETEGFHVGQDETFSEVFKDFTNMANNQPDKLNRNK